MNKLRMLALCLMLSMIFAFSMFVSSQENTPTVTPLPTPSIDARPFPNGMYCNEIETASGSSWHGIAVGESTLNEFERQLFSLSEEYAVIQRPNPMNLGILYSVTTEIAVESQIPRAVTICVADDIITSIRVSNTGFPEPSMFIDDWIINLGRPDIVTWGASSLSRVAFWFEEGIALNVFVGEPEYGAVFSTIYLPYQEMEGYENRFPYNRTAIIPFAEDAVRQPPIPTQQNPFDFDAMIATITAEPSRTPTFTPIATEVP